MSVLLAYFCFLYGRVSPLKRDLKEDRTLFTGGIGLKLNGNIGRTQSDGPHGVVGQRGLLVALRVALVLDVVLLAQRLVETQPEVLGCLQQSEQVESVAFPPARATVNEGVGTSSVLTILEMVISSLFWFHIRASVVRCPSAAIRICSTVQSMDSFSKFCSNQLSSYQPTVQKQKKKSTIIISRMLKID